MNKHGNKRKKALLISLSSVAILAVGLLSFIKGPNTTRIKALDDPYTLDITGLKKDNTVLKTTNGNDIEFLIGRYGEGTFLTDGYIQNVTPISGIQSLSVAFTTTEADLTISFGWYYGDYYVTDGIVNSEHTIYEFGDLGPSFFKIENKCGATLKTTEIEITYSCSETHTPVGYTNVEYTLASNGLSYYVSGYKEGISKAIILSEYNGLPVTEIGDGAFQSCPTLTTVEIPNSVSTIGIGAFVLCESLQTVTIPSSVTSIEAHAFYRCESLRSIVLPDSVNSLGYQVFGDCISLVSIRLSKNISVIPESTFSWCTSISSFVVPDSIREIGDHAFEGSSLHAILIPDTVDTIGVGAFDRCALAAAFYEGSESEWNSINFGTDNDELFSSLIEHETNVNRFDHVINEIISYDVTNDNRVFSLKIIDKTISSFEFETELPGLNIVSLGFDAFTDCLSLESIVIPDSVLVIDRRAFNNCTSLASAILPNGISSIYTGTFYSCSSLLSIDIPDSVVSIGSSAFSNCSNLVSVRLPSTLSILGDTSFSSCRSLTSIIIPDGITTIYSGTFSGCSKLKSVIIPASVTLIGEGAFYSCYLNFVFYKGIELEWDSIDVRDDNDLLLNANVEFETGVSTITKVVTSKCSYEITNDNRVMNLKVIDRSITSFNFDTELPGLTVLSLDYEAFYWCDSLNSIELPNTVISIPYYGFYACKSITSIVIPDSVTSIGWYAFSGCSSLSSIYIPSTVSEIGGYAFQYCNNLTIYCEASTKPAGWNDNWNPGGRPVVWGYSA